MIARALKYALSGAVMCGLAGWFMFGGAGYNSATGNYGWGPIMAPTFVIIGAVVGLLTLALVSIWFAVRRRMVDAADSARNQRVGPDAAEWNNASNWTAGVFYRSRADSRIFVPQKLPGGWFTINFGQPLGVAIGGILFVVLVITIFSMFKS